MRFSKRHHLALAGAASVLLSLAIGGCGAEADGSQDATPATSQPTTQPAMSGADSHGTVGDVPALSGQPVFIHMVTSFDEDDNPACVAFNAALAALKRGRPVIMFFDAGAVTDLKVWQGSPTALRYELPEKLKEMLSRRYDVSPADLPTTYQHFLYALHDAGATIAANGFMAELVSLTDDPTKPGQLEPIVAMWSLEDLLQHRERSSDYLRY